MRLALFDVDGTLIDADGSGRRALEKAFAETFDLGETPELAGRVRFSGELDPVIHREIARLLDISSKELEAGRKRLLASYLAHLESACGRPGKSRVLPGVQRLLERLDGTRDLQLGLITGNLEAGARIKMAPHHLNHFFPSGGFGEDGPDRAAVARVAVERVAAGPAGPVEAALVTIIGDSERDVECGRSNSYRTLAVASGWTSWQDLAASEPDHLVADLVDTDRLLEILTK
ncbi:MAG: haloacid dehalogenase-like hydrolase [Acidobacteria bacterium]|nr:haloacid dehalogenase-like hydrolase [Acidobacteriota bacterium]